MFDNNMFMQVCSIVGSIFMICLIASTILYNKEWMYEIECPNIVRFIMIIILIGLIRGAT